MQIMLGLLRLPQGRLREIWKASSSVDTFMRSAVAEALGKPPEALTEAELREGKRVLDTYLNPALRK